jgi:hypothetical protein
MSTQTQPVFTFRTYNPKDCTSSGYDIEFFDAYAILTYHTCWQGGVTGTVYKADLTRAVTGAILREINRTDHGHEPDLETAIEDWIESDEARAKWVRIRKGSRIV